MLIVLRHSNLVNLIGFCADGDERLLVYEYMPQGSLESHLCGKLPLPPTEDSVTVALFCIVFYHALIVSTFSRHFML